MILIGQHKDIMLSIWNIWFLSDKKKRHPIVLIQNNSLRIVATAQNFDWNLEAFVAMFDFIRTLFYHRKVLLNRIIQENW